MSLITAELKIIKGQDKIMYIPSFLIKELNITTNKRIPIYFGLTSKTEVLIKATDSKKHKIFITTSLKKNLLVPYKKTIMLRKEDAGLRIGPIIGVFTTDLTGRKFSNNTNGKPHPHSSFFKKVIDQDLPVFSFVFTPQNINWSSKTINAFFYKKDTNGAKKWVKITVPFPDVIYNRIPNRSVEKSPRIKRFKDDYIQQGGKLFNYQFFNKWEMSKVLKNCPDCIKYLPETYSNPTLESLTKMVKKYPIIYLKPANGSLGLGIYKIIKNGKRYTLNYRGKSRNISLTFKAVSSIYRYVFSRKNSRNYLVQQGIDLVKYHKSPVDFRVHLNKNRQNEWKVVAIGAKVAGKNSVTTHLRTGGKIVDFHNFIRSKFDTDTLTVINKIHSTAILIAENLESELNQPLGELGFDIGIDKQQNIWLFEVNSKPGHSIFNYPKLKSAGKESRHQLINYAIYLAKFGNRD